MPARLALKMKILGLDLATITGWAVSDGSSGIFSIAPRKGESVGVRYLTLRKRLNAIIEKHQDLKLVGYEHPLLRGYSSTYAAGYTAVVQEWCANHGLECAFVWPSELKKFVTGSGNASKEDVIAAVQMRGFTPVDDNEADAISVMLWAQDKFV